MNRTRLHVGVLVVLLAAGPAMAQDTPTPASVLDGLDTLWVLIAAALVFFMQAGFGMVEAGLIRTKNAGNVLMKIHNARAAPALMTDLRDKILPRLLELDDATRKSITAWIDSTGLVTKCKTRPRGESAESATPAEVEQMNDIVRLMQMPWQREMQSLFRLQSDRKSWSESSVVPQLEIRSSSNTLISPRNQRTEVSMLMSLSTHRQRMTMMMSPKRLVVTITW